MVEENRLTEHLWRLLETWRLTSGRRKIMAWEALLRMAELADCYFKNHPDPSRIFNARNVIESYLQEYRRVKEEPRRKILEILTEVALHAELTLALRGPPTVGVIEELLAKLFKSSAWELLKLWCLCCGRLAAKDQLFCPACENSRCKNSSILLRHLLHAVRRRPL